MLLSLLLTQVVRAAGVSQTWGVGDVGPEPFGITVDPRDGKVYVAISNHVKSGAEYMWAIDPTVPLPWDPTNPPRFPLPSPQVMSVLDTALDRLFVPLTGGLGIIDVPSRSLLVTVANGGTLAVALDPATHRVYATSNFGGLSMTDGATGTLLAHASAGADAYWAVAQDAGRHRVYVANLNYAAPSVIAFDDRDLTEVGRVALPEVPRLALAVDAARGLVYVGGFSGTTGRAGGHLYAIDEASLTVAKTVDVGLGTTAPFWITFDAASDLLYVSGISQFAGEIAVVDTGSFTVVKRIPLPWQPGGTALHPDGRLYVAGFSSSLLAAISLVNQPPVVGEVAFSPAPPDTSSLLRANVSVSDPDGDPLTFTYEWRRNGALIPGATGAVLDLGAAGNGDRGDTVSVRVSVSDGEFTVTREATVLIGNAAPTLILSLDATSPRTNDVLHASASASDADGDTVSLAYSWTRNGAVIAGATGTTLDLALYGDRGDVIALRVTADDAHGGVTTRTATVTVADSAPVLSLTTNTTTLRTNDTIFATATMTDADGDGVCCAWYFKRNGTVIWHEFSQTGGITRSFDLSQPGWGDRGDTVTIEAVAGDGLLETHASVDAVVLNSPPLGGVTLSDYSPLKRDGLIAYGSVFDADGDAVLFTYTWQVGSKTKLIVGPTSAPSSSFDLRELQPGDVVTVTVTPQTDGFDPGVPASASATIRSGK